MAWKLRHNPWRGRKWVDTRFAKKYRTEVMISYAMAASSIAAGHARISAINSQFHMPAFTRRAQLALEVVRAARAASEVLRDSREKANQRWRI